MASKCIPALMEVVEYSRTLFCPFKEVTVESIACGVSSVGMGRVSRGEWVRALRP